MMIGMPTISGDALSRWLRRGMRYVFLEGGWRLLVRPRTVYNYWLAHRQSAAQRVAVDYQPTHIEVELSNRCNLACVQCLRASTDIGAEGGMTLETFQRILAQFPHVVVVALNGFGEIFLNRNYLEIVRWLNAARPWVRLVITTNGTFFTPKVVEEILSVRIARLDISLDAATSGTYRAVRQAPQFERIVQGIRLLLAERARRGMSGPLIGVNFVLLDQNIDEVPAMIRLAHELGVDRITSIRGEFSPWGYANRTLRPAAAVAAILAEGQRLARELGVEILESILNEASHVADYAPGLKRSSGFCLAFWNNLRIDFQGKIMLCCNSPLEKDWSYGSLLERPLAEIWNGPIFQEVRKKAKAGGYITPMCESCRPVLPVQPAPASSPG